MTLKKGETMKVSFKYFFVLFFTAPLTLAQANPPSFPFHGVWIGSGQTLENNTKHSCENIKFTIQQTESHLRFVEEEFTCEKNINTRLNIDFEIHGNELWIDNKKAGSLNDTEFFIDILEQKPKHFIQLAVYGQIENGRFRYSEIIHYRLNGESGKNAIAAEMRLKSQIE